MYDTDNQETDFLDFEGEVDERWGVWEHYGVKIKTADNSDIPDPSEDDEDSESSGDGNFLVPDPSSLTGNNTHKIIRNLTLEARSLLEIQFLLYVSSYNASAETDTEAVPDKNPRFDIHFIDIEDDIHIPLLNIRRIVRSGQASEGVWSSCKFGGDSGSILEKKTFSLEISLRDGDLNGGQIAVDNIEVSWTPVLESEKQIPHVPVFTTTTTTTTTTGSTTIKITSTTASSTSE